MKHLLKKAVCGLLSALMLGCSAATFAAAQTDSTQYIKITGTNFVADTLDGIPAYYNQYNRNWQCVEYMKRYYKEIFGIDMNIGYSAPYITRGEGSFVQTECPRTGDVVYWPSFLRNVNYGHVAIVKDYADGVITLIEQNWRYDGKAAVERQVSFPSKSFYVYTLTGEKADKIRGEKLGIWDLTTENEDVAVVSSWAVQYVDELSENKLFDTSFIVSYTEPITRLAFCTMNAELISAVNPDVAQLPLTDLAAISETLEAREDLKRQEAAQIIVKYDDLGSLIGCEIDTEEILSQFTDSDLIRPEARDAMALLVHLGVFTGTGDGKLAPDSLATGEQAVTWLMRTYAVIRSTLY